MGKSFSAELQKLEEIYDWARAISIDDLTTAIMNMKDHHLLELSASEAEDLITAGVVAGGMIPKIRACLRAAAGNSTSFIIDDRQTHSLLEIIGEGMVGTTIKGG